MSGVGSRETGLDSLFALKPAGPGFEPCLGQSAKLAGAPKPLCLSVSLLPTGAGRPVAAMCDVSTMVTSLRLMVGRATICGLGWLQLSPALIACAVLAPQPCLASTQFVVESSHLKQRRGSCH